MAKFKRTQLDASEQALRPMTLGELEAKAVAVLCWCNRCSHFASVAAAVLAAQLGPQVAVPEIGVHMRSPAAARRTSPPGPTGRHWDRSPGTAEAGEGAFIMICLKFFANILSIQKNIP